MAGVAGIRRGRQRLISEINVTPFVDVVLVLLIIFMVTLPLMQQGIAVDLPETESTPVQLSDEPLTITVKKDGATYIAEQAVALEGFEQKLKAILDERGAENVYVRADGDAPYAAVAKVLAAAQNAGVSGLGLVTEPE